MVDFDKLKPLKARARPIEPLEIFRRLPKPPGINDLYTSQAEVLETWFGRRDDRDVVVKLHTGGGKTLVGLLMAESTRNELKEPVLYLAPTRQLVNQTLEKARDLGIDAVAYNTKAPLDDDFLNGKAIMVATYKALFNGKSKFRVRGEQGPVLKSTVSAIRSTNCASRFINSASVGEPITSRVRVGALRDGSRREAGGRSFRTFAAM